VSSTAVLTVSSKDRLAPVRVLFESLQRFHPDWRRVLLLADRIEDAFDPAAEPFEVVQAEDLDIAGFRHMAFASDALSLCCSLKPHGLRFLFEACGCERAIYLDSDILVTGALRPVVASLDRHDIVLTPHLTDHLPDDGLRPDETHILKYGTYNAGCLALRRGDTADRFLDWWARHLQHDCRFSPEEGLFHDQKWLDMVPGIYGARCLILREPGCNVATWNLSHRRLSRGATGVLRAGDRPLTFFHFSGFSPDYPRRVDRGDRWTWDVLNESERTLFEEYGRRLREAGYLECRRWPYAYGRFSDGTPVHPAFRRLFRAGMFSNAESPEDPFDATGEVMACLEAAWPDSRLVGAAVALLLSLASGEHDVPTGTPLNDERRFAEWFAAEGARRAGMAGRFAEAQRRVLRSTAGGVATASRSDWVNRLLRRWCAKEPALRRTCRLFSAAARRPPEAPVPRFCRFCHLLRRALRRISGTAPPTS